MKFISRIVLTLVKNINIESVIINLSKNNKWIQKFIPLNTFYAPDTFKMVVRDNAQFKLDISDYMQWYIWADLEDASWKLAVSNFRNNSTIIDVGANVGAFTLKAAANLLNEKKDFNLIAFEPNPFVFKLLASNVELNNFPKNNINILPLGVSSESGELKFSWGKSNSGGGKIIFYNEDAVGISESIKAISLDEFIFRKNIKNVSFIKIDVEGHEPFVINGAKKTISEYKPDLFIEVNPRRWSDNGFLMKDIFNYFNGIKYNFYPLINEKFGDKVEYEELLTIKDQYNLFLSIQ